jgi:hypothetical protein
MLYVKIKTKPITVFLRFIRILFFYVNGGNFRVSAYVKNLDSVKFQGGQLKILVTYAFGQLEEAIEGKIGVIEPGKVTKVDFEGADKWGVVANGHALFWANVVDNNGLVTLCDENSRPLNKQPDGYHVHTFHALSVAEFFTLTALLVNSLAFIANIILTSYINREKLTNAWSFLVINSAPIALLVLVLVVLWTALVYLFYDSYGL